MLVSFNPYTPNRQAKKQSVAFQALDINKISSSVNEANKLYIVVKHGKIQKTPENVNDLLTAINQTKDIEIKATLMEMGRDLWGLFSK